MATTDFLLQSTTPSRVHSSTADKTAHQRSPAAPEHSFSSVYAQQQRASTANQQHVQQQNKQRDAALQQDKQQQAARHSVTKNAAAPVKDQSVPATQKVVGTQKPSTDTSAQRSEYPHQTTTTDTTVEDSDAVSAQELEQSLAEAEEDLLDPLLLMALAAIPTEYTTDISSAGAGNDTELLLGGTKISFTLQGEAAPSDELELEQDEVLVLAKSGSAAGDIESDDPSIVLSNASGKGGDGLTEKTNADKNSSAALLDTVKAAPDTLLNSKAVAPTDTIRADMQPRPESLLAAEQTRQVPGAAVAMQQPGWTQDVTDKVMWMSSQNLKTAEIKLDPAELGRLDIKIDMTQEHMQVSFSSANAGVRESLESQMYRLRELFAQQGMQNVDVDVSDQSQQQARTQEQTATQGLGSRNAEGEADTQQHITSIREQQDGRLGLVDYYA